jgi:hypothetical protein
VSARGRVTAVLKGVGIAALLFLAYGGVLTWVEYGSKSYPVKLIKYYETDCGLVNNAGTQYEMARVESEAVCASIARAYNFARTAERPERSDEFGSCWASYNFHCTSD